jgi:hypothetical protein
MLDTNLVAELINEDKVYLLVRKQTFSDGVTKFVAEFVMEEYWADLSYGESENIDEAIMISATKLKERKDKGYVREFYEKEFYE